jgi:prepilin-type processing-associated H-X9-DG protein
MSEPRTGRRIFWIEAIVVAVIVVVAAALILPAIQQAREAARRTQSSNILKDLGLALFNYHDTFQQYPPGGTFAADGTPYQSWTISLLPYMDASPLYFLIDPNRPWDDPVNFDVIVSGRFKGGYAYRDPAVPIQKTESGLWAIHYSPNQWLMYRNSSVRIDDIPDREQTLLMADAFGGYAGFGDPFNWRDATLPYRASAVGFGHLLRTSGTQILFADGHVEFVSKSVAPAITATYAGPESLKPAPELIAQRSEPYRIPDRPIWKYFFDFRGWKSMMRIGLSPDRLRLDVNFYDVPVDRREDSGWKIEFAKFARDMPIRHVTVVGMLAADELRPFLELPQLKTLDLTDAKIEGDAAAILGTAPQIEVIGAP